MVAGNGKPSRSVQFEVSFQRAKLPRISRSPGNPQGNPLFADGTFAVMTDLLILR